MTARSQDQGRTAGRTLSGGVETVAVEDLAVKALRRTRLAARLAGGGQTAAVQ